MMSNQRSVRDIAPVGRRKKIKSVMIIMVLFVGLAITGCSGAQSAKAFAVINSAMSDAFEQNAVDMSISIDLTAKRKVFKPFYPNTATTTSTARVKVIDDGVNPSASFVSKIDGVDEVVMYYTDGWQYLYSPMEDKPGCYTSRVDEVDFYEAMDEDDYTDLGINLYELEALKPSIKKLNKEKYEIKIKKADIKKIIDLDDIEGVDFGDIVMTIWIDSNTELFKNLEATFTFETEDINFTMEMLIEIVAIGDKVEIAIPDMVLSDIESVRYPYNHSREKYTDTLDGAVKYYKLGAFGIDGSVLYDDKTDKFIVSRKFSIYGAEIVHIYDSSFTLLHTFSYPEGHGAIAVDCENGVLALSRDSTIYLYDLEDYSLIKTIESKVVYKDNYMDSFKDHLIDLTIMDFALDGDSIIYTGYGIMYIKYTNHTIDVNVQFVVLCDLSTDKQRVLSNNVNINSSTSITINRKDHVAYVATSYGQAELVCFDSQTGAILYQISGDQLHNLNNNNYVHKSALFDGRFVHFYRGTYDPVTGEMVSDTGLNVNYNALQGFTPYETLLDNRGFAVITEIGGRDNYVENPLTAIYDNENSKYVYSFNFSSTYAGMMKDGRIFCINGTYDQIAILDMTKISGEINGNY